MKKINSRKTGLPFRLALLALRLSLVYVAYASPIFSQAEAQNAEQVRIEADDGIEWRRNDQVYEATGNVVAIRGDLTVNAQVLRAFYRESEPGSTDIFMMEAVGSVVINSQNAQALGDRAIYDVDTGRIVISGQNVQLITSDYTIFADGNIEFFRDQNYAVANGGAKAIIGTRQVRADTLIAYFLPDNNLEVDQLIAEGNMVIVTPTETVQADRGTYDPQTEIATASGNVQITRGDSHLVGEEAHVDMVTGISTITAGAAGQRVLGIFTPGSFEPQN